MRKIHARTLLSYTTEELWGVLIDSFIVVFDDNTEMITNYREMLYTSYFWDIHRMYPSTPLLRRHHVNSVLKGKSLTSSTHELLLGIIYDDVKQAYNMLTPISRDGLTKMVYEITNTLYNVLIQRTEAFVVSLDILDFLAVLDHPSVDKVLSAPTNTQVFIDDAYAALSNTINNEPALATNPISMASRSKLINNSQMLQCLGPRGYLTDINSIRFPIPITRGYAVGLRSLYDSVVESRSAAKALFFSEDPLQDAEYFSRRLQLLAMTVERLHYTDCGSQDYLLWRVKAPDVKNGIVIYPGDLKFIVGKYYLDDDTNTLKIVSENDKHLYGKVIKMRSVVSGCLHPDPRGVCSVCFGAMSDNVTPDSNLGHNCATGMTQQTSQAVLSTKHYDGTSLIEAILVGSLAKPFLTTDKAGNSYFLNASLKGKTVKITLTPEDAFGLTDILLVKHVEDINISRISQIDIMGIEVINNDKVVSEILPVSFKGRYGMLTHDLLRFIKCTRWTYDAKGNFVFDLTTWDYTLPIITLPDRQYNMSDHSHSISEIIEARVKDLTDRANSESPASTLVDLFDIVNSKLNVNLALLEIIIYASMIVSNENNDYRLPKPWTDKGLGVASLTIPSRSLSCAYAYEGQYRTIISPKSFFQLNRPDSPMDIYIMPEALELMNYKYN